MGQKTHPIGFRVGITRKHDSRWYANKKEFPKLLQQDQQIRKYIKQQFQGAQIPRIEIERSRELVRILVHCAKPGVLIGRKGQTLEALQYLVTRIVSERHGGDAMPHIVIDIENYRERRRRSLEDLALRLGEKAKRQRKTVTVDALSAADRRIVHAALQDDPWLSTKSLGQGAYRRLLIIPEGDRKTKEAAPPAKQGGKPSAKNGDSEAFRSHIDEDN